MVVSCRNLQRSVANRRTSKKYFTRRVPKTLPYSLGIEGVTLPDNWIPETRNRLARRRARKPDTKAGQLWALWPEIKAALAEGQSIRTVLGWLEEDAGIVVSLGSFTSYISRNRKREAAERIEEAARSFARAHDVKTKSVSTPVPASSGSERKDSAANNPALSQSDPMARTIAALRQRRFDIREAHQNGDPTNVKLI
jgi:hypothetical protein